MSEETYEPSRRDVQGETLAVLAFAVLPDLCWSIHPWLFGAGSFAGSVPSHAFAILVRSVAVSVPVLFLISRSGLGWERFGLVRPRWVRDPLAGCAAFLLLVVANRLFEIIAWLWIGPSLWAVPDWVVSEPLRPRGTVEFGLVVAMDAANAFAEELVMRAYLLERFERLLGSKFDAVIASSVLFAGYHTYQGFGSAVQVFLFGLVVSVGYLRGRRLWPWVVAHLMWNVTLIYDVQPVLCGG